MAKKQEKETPLAEVDSKSAPSFIEHQEGVRDGFEDMVAGDIATPVATLIQKMHDDEITGEHGVGSLVVLSSGLKLCDKDSSVLVVPVKHYVDYCEWDPQDKTRSKPPINRSTDRNGDLAKRFEKNEKVENADGKEVWAITASHRFICLVKGVPYPVMFIFRKTSYKHGKNWLNLMFYRGDYPIYAGQYSLTPTKESNAAGQEFYVLKAQNAGWVEDKGTYDAAKKLHAQVKTISHVVAVGDEGNKEPEPAAAGPEI